MTGPREYLDYLADIVAAMTKIEGFVAGMDLAGFIRDDKTNFAVVRAFEIIGEATKQIPEDVRMKYPDVPWTKMARMRDRLIHGYFVLVKWIVEWQKRSSCVRVRSILHSPQLAK